MLATVAVAPPSGYGGFLLESLLILLGVCGLAWVVVRFGLGRLHGARAARGPMRVVARLPLEPRRTLYVVEVAGKTLLVGASEGGLGLVAELDGERLAAPSSEAGARPRRFLEVWKGAAPRRDDSRWTGQA